MAGYAWLWFLAANIAGVKIQMLCREDLRFRQNQSRGFHPSRFSVGVMFRRPYVICDTVLFGYGLINTRLIIYSNFSEALEKSTDVGSWLLAAARQGFRASVTFHRCLRSRTVHLQWHVIGIELKFVCWLDHLLYGGQRKLVQLGLVTTRPYGSRNAELALVPQKAI